MKLPLKINSIRHLVDAENKIIAAVSEFSLDEAKEIIRACNAHDDLLAGLKWALEYGTFDVAENNPLHANEHHKAWAAIRKATKEV